VTPAQRPRVLALGIDGSNQELLLRWMAEGLLPNMRKLQERGARIAIRSDKKFSNEHCWIPVLTGRSRDRWDHWLDQWDPRAYEFNEASIFDWLQAPVFYALGEQRRVIAFDLTAPVVPGVNGLQIVGWASELNESFPASDPPQLLDELLQRHGPDPKLSDAAAVTNRLSDREGISHVLPSVYDTQRLADYAQGQLQSVRRRTAACLDVMARIDWDFFIATYSESHTAGHLLWHLSQPHPLGVLGREGVDPLLAVHQAIDESIGELLAQAADTDHVVLFTIDAIVPDCLENARAVLLPELMYRWNFPGQRALAAGDDNAPVPAARLDYSRHWKHEVWELRTREGERELASPADQEAQRDAMSWCPANWYAPLWPRMRAFALPTVADGYIRVNVEGREAHGIVPESEFEAVCEDIATELRAMVNARTGEPVVREVIQVRASPFDADPRKPPADLIVVFREDSPVDAVRSPRAGLIGPVPYFRTGSHQAHGVALDNLMYVAGPGIAAGDVPGTARLEDIPATLLKLLGLDVPADFDGIARV
jgi:hypothetical protein